MQGWAQLMNCLHFVEDTELEEKLYDHGLNQRILVLLLWSQGDLDSRGCLGELAVEAIF